MHIQMRAAVLEVSIRRDGREEGETFREVQRSKRCSPDTNREGVHPQSNLMTHEDTEIPNR